MSGQLDTLSRLMTAAQLKSDPGRRVRRRPLFWSHEYSGDYGADHGRNVAAATDGYPRGHAAGY